MDADEVVSRYQKMVKNLSVNRRKEIFFLAANDKYYKPHMKPLGKSIVTDIYKKDHQKAKFIDVPLDNNEQGYFIIAAPSTWPPFATKMNDLVALLKTINGSFKIIMIYLAEAHADDVWPLGYGIT